MLFSFLLSIIFCNTKSYLESPSESIKYIPGSKNEHVGVKGLKATSDGIKLRRSLEQGGIVYFLVDNKYPEWSFSYTITDINLHFPEEGGVYLWYTSHDQDFGEFRGGNGVFHGMMAGIEFKGASPELVFTFNGGEDFNDNNENLYRDSFSPDRLKGVKNLTVKVIVTKNNFKIELYDKDKLLYDSMRIVSLQPHALLGIDKRFSITSFYNNTSSEKAFKLLNAQLYERKELENYDADKIHAENVAKLPIKPDEVMHPDKEIRHFIANFSHFLEYIKSVLGETDKPYIKFYSDKILGEIENVIKKVNVLSDNTIYQHINDRVNDMDIRLQSVHKNLTDLLHIIESNQYKSKKSNLFTYVLIGLGCGIFALLGLKEYKNWIFQKKSY